ncbi:putative phage abortive infection protein [Lactiplantibacillus plantarum]|uniref:putative phage abortive infection protein n=1 Tax=Lactiplantibacillus plantarum TaxID=1590 RepID=UPI0007C84877|nr:putative phage abortive infection protein [Lactiplantibacillus plantarum]ANM74790.1 hypothetical protein A8P51_10335 [Lactiplantibacillus plantarum]ARW36083.1 hypothetical protein S102022_02138 [Lactiplantibacillus plantarum]MCT3206843.1 hypothetical protein [Lactiplantibacillus plantarum]MCT3219450.1 hypothetical protein [Lactiplantibacillus plantarum]OAH22067.1 hypothetical protein AYJ51_04085 [Lactiplantibacillus plantarum]
MNKSLRKLLLLAVSTICMLLLMFGIFDFSGIVAVLALLLSVYTTYSSAKEKDRSDFEGLFFHLLTLLEQTIGNSDTFKSDIESLKNDSDTFIYNKKVSLFNKNTYLLKEIICDIYKGQNREIALNQITLITNSDDRYEYFKALLIQKKEEDYYKDLFGIGMDEVLTEKREKLAESSIDFTRYGQFFRTVHRIVKLLLDRSTEEQQKYIGVLRTQLSEEQLVLLYYNAEYTQRGKKFKANVNNMDLWGDKEELGITPPMHFNDKLLVWPDDLEILKNEYTSK